jgi:hypothetical protein
MDWFFNQYVHGTQLPSYSMISTFDTDAAGDVVLNFKVTQSEVDERFKMPVPIYLDMPDGNVFPVGVVKLRGNSTIEQTVPLKGFKIKPRRAVLNYFNDVLASPDEVAR